MTTSITENKFILSYIEEGYYDLYVKDNVELFVEDIDLIRDSQKKLNGGKHPVLIHGGKYSTTNVEVMKYISKNINMPYSKVSAYVAASTSQKLLGNFYMKINTPERPTKFFSTKDEAIKWLKQYL